MTYVAFLRGVNVGGRGIVSMAAIKEALVALGLSDVRTYINSCNVIFSTRFGHSPDLEHLGRPVRRANGGFHALSPANYSLLERGTSLMVVDRASGVSTLLRMLPAYLRYLAR